MRIELPKSLFHFSERAFLRAGAIEISTFGFPSGVEGVRIRSPRLNLVVLPYLGQQIWSAEIDGIDIGMKSMVRTPRRGVPLLRNFGGFFVHCGITAIAAPGEGDTHVLHGELPSAELDEAWIEVSEEGGATTVSVNGAFEYAEAFKSHYRFAPSVKVTENSSELEIAVHVENLKRTPMDLCYLGHANFRPVDGSRLVYAADYSPSKVAVRRAVPSHLAPSDQYLALLSEFANDPTGHHLLRDGVLLDPEVVFKIDYIADESGWAHALQLHEDGSADWIAHRPDQLPHGFRWLSRTPDQDCLAITEPATCGIEGYNREKAQGRVPSLPPGGSWYAHMRIGRLAPPEAAEMVSAINRTCGRTG